MDLPSLKLTAKAARITYIPGTPSVPFFKATLPLNPATIALKIGHLAFQVYIYIYPGINIFLRCGRLHLPSDLWKEVGVETTSWNPPLLFQQNPPVFTSPEVN